MNKSIIKRIGAGAVCFAAALAACLGFLGGSADATTSLPHIEQLTTGLAVSGGSYAVLEIAPGEGSIGYYIAGQEPSANWLDTLAALSTKAARESYADGLFSSLTARGLLGSDSNAAPLYYQESPTTNEAGETVYYEEAYPWENHDGMEKLTLQQPETVPSVRGFYTYAGDGVGSFDANWTFAMDSENGVWNQNITKLSYGQQLAAGGYYYLNPTFQQVAAPVLTDVNHTPDDKADDEYVFAELASGDAVYAAVTGTDSAGAPVYQTAAQAANPTAYPEVTVQHYDCVGVMGEGLELNGTIQYFTLQSAGAPTDTYSQTAYAAIADGFLLAGDVNGDGEIGEGETQGTGLFARNLQGYSYVGEGEGEFAFTADPSGEYENDVTTKDVYYKGGYQNSNWFCNQVLNLEPEEYDSVKFSVNTVTPDKVTAAMVEAADLIVLAGGYSAPASTAATFSAGISDAIYAAVTADTNMTPVILDYDGLRGATGDIAALGQRILDDYVQGVSDADHTYLYRNVLCLSASMRIGGTAVGDLATALFGTEITGDGIQGMEAVGEEIRYENFLRRQQGLEDDLLPDSLTLSRALRYAINYAGQRTVEEKTSIRVLEVEPATATQQLTASMVKSWLPDDTAVTDISITTMSMYEFAGKLEDLSETYDLIYLGDSTSGVPTYLDDNMTGLLYTNVGDEVVTKAQLAGMLNRDYTTLAQTNLTGYAESYTFRYSGNDLTESRKNDLVSFANAGYPVILGNSLVTTEPHSGQSVSFTALLSQSSSDNDSADLTVSQVEDQYGSTLTPTGWTWYRSTDGVSFTEVGAGSATRHVALAGSTPEYYYCEVTVEGSATPARTRTIKLTGNQLVTVAQSGDADSGSYMDPTAGGTAFSAALSGVNSGTTYGGPKGSALTMTVTPKAGSQTVSADGREITYQWQRCYYSYPYYDSDWSNISGETDASLSISQYGSYRYYRCVVTINGSSATSAWVRLTSQSGNGRFTAYMVPYSDVSGVFYPQTNFTVGVTDSNRSADGCTLTAAAAGANVSGNATVKYYWSTSDSWSSYYGYSPDWSDWTATGSSFSPTLGGATARTYYCYAFYFYQDDSYDYYDEFSADYARSMAVTVSRQTLTAETTAEASTGVYTLYDAVNDAKIDNSSCLYEGLDGILAYGNVMTASKAAASQETVSQYLNLSKPEIVWTDGDSSYPTAYEMENGVMTSLTAEDGIYYLNYAFKIENNTDATPTSTTYDCRLYIDQDSSGRYSDDEQITDIVVRENGTIVRPVGGRYQLRAGIAYTVSRQMPSSFAGVISWKLEAVKNTASGDSSVHASKTGYTRISGEESPQQIQILQITSSRTSTLCHVNLEWQLQAAAVNNPSSDCYSSVTGKTYNGIYGKLLADVTDFDIQITTVRADALESFLGESNADDIYDALVQNYNMIIIGYDDMYQELSQESAQGIVQFIDSGKSVLFTHDTTSLSNVNPTAKNNRTAATGQVLSFSDPSYWGYYFNSILRTPVGLDRYGIRSALSGSLAAQTASTNLTAAQIEALESADFSIAYEPNSGKTQTVAETQGYSNYDLIRYMTSGSRFVTGLSSSGRETTTVSQLNQGQITTYPYNVNTALFETGSGSDTMSVGTTHEQPFQINLNSDDTVVWYCLSSGYYLKNDAMNAYYIFSKGNVTYSGMGHSVSTTYLNYQGNTIGAQYVNEAKLFVNTMIAAYRTVYEAPSVKFTTDKLGSEQVKYYFLKSNGAISGSDGSLLEGQSAFGTDTDSTLTYFKLSDPNLNKDKTISAALYYTSDKSITEYDQATQITELPTVTLAETGAAAAFGNLTGGVVYSFHLPQAVLDELGSDGVDSVRLFLHITTIIDGKPYENTATLDLRKLGLSDLK